MNTPMDMDDPTFNEWYEKYGEPLLNSECLLGVKEDRTQNLLYRIVVDTDPIYGVVFTARDPATFDPDPESANCVIGYGTSREQAIADLLEQLEAQ